MLNIKIELFSIKFEFVFSKKDNFKYIQIK